MLAEAREIKLPGGRMLPEFIFVSYVHQEKSSFKSRFNCSNKINEFRTLEIYYFASSYFLV